MGALKKPAGTPLYVAPEHFMQNVGLGSDMWSLGMLFYQLLCGRLPFADTLSAKKSPMDVMMAILSEDVKFEGPRWGCISKEAQSLIMQMLDRDYNTRVRPSAAARIICTSKILSTNLEIKDVAVGIVEVDNYAV